MNLYSPDKEISWNNKNTKPWYIVDFLVFQAKQSDCAKIYS